MRRPHAVAVDGRNDSGEAGLEASAPCSDAVDDDARKRLRLGPYVRRAAIVGGLILLGLGLVWHLSDDGRPTASSATPPFLAAAAGGAPVLSAGVHRSLAETGATSTPSVPPEAEAPKSEVVAAPKVESAEEEEAKMNAILDDLLNLHRKDEASREVVTVPPEDLPVSYSEDSVVVSMADGGYAACVIRLLESVRGPGRWGGAMAVLVPTGEGSVPLPHTAEERLKELGATLFPVLPEAAGGTRTRGAGSAAQYGKIRLLTDESFRRYKTILFLDADGLVGAPLQPLLELVLPAGRSVAMPSWPSVEAPKETFYAREISMSALSPTEAAALRECCPDRLLVGLTAWFLLKSDRLPSPSAMRAEVDSALVKWRPAFRFNDQGLWNVLFYNVSVFYPLCLSGPAGGPQDFRPFLQAGGLQDNLEGLGDVIDVACGPVLARRRPMFAHPLKDCLPDEQWERAKRANRELPGSVQNDINKAFDEAKKLGRR